MLKSYTFPSVYEATNMELRSVASDLLNGMKIKMGEDEYMVGNLVLLEGMSPNKNINASPQDEEYKLLTDAAMLLVHQYGAPRSFGGSESGESVKISLTTGFPFVTYQLFRDLAVDYFKGSHVIEYDGSTIGLSEGMKKEVEVVKVNVIPEIMGCNVAIREGEMQEDQNIFIVSLGYGTCEAVVSTKSGLVHRSLISTHGIRYAVNSFAGEMSKQFNIGIKNEHQLDQVFLQGSIVVNRKRVNVHEVREKALKLYFKQIILPALIRSFTDEDFKKCSKMYLVGGGALYPELVACFEEEFAESVGIEVYPEPEKCASQGYCLYSRLMDSASQNRLDSDQFDIEKLSLDGDVLKVGIDIGNANTCVTLLKD